MSNDSIAERKYFEDSLKAKITSHIQNKKYYIASFEYDWGCFGNIIVEISSTHEKFTLKFISDRGDIYIQSSCDSLESWKEIGWYPNNDDREYNLLFKAVSDFTK